jgi:hypothetical protein
MIPITDIDVNKLINYIPYLSMKQICYSAGITPETLRNWRDWKVTSIKQDKLEQLISSINYREDKETGFITKKIKKITLKDILIK